MLNRRDFAKALLGCSSLPFLPSLAQAQKQSTTPLTSSANDLTIASRILEVNGKAAKVFGLSRANGQAGLELAAEEQVSFTLHNRLAAPTMIHWHGLTPPLEFDGMPDHPLPMLKPDEIRAYQLPAGLSGTHWMHAHTLQEQQLLAAPLIIRSKEDLARDEQDITLLLHDFSFTSPEELLGQLTGGMANHDHAMMTMDKPMDHNMPGMMSAGTAGMDVNDLNYDAYLANDRTLDDPEIFTVEKSGKVRLRIINAASSTGFTIMVGALKAELIAVDGQDVAPLSISQWPLSMGQRVDLRLQIPSTGGAFPILARREGDRAQTGIILATNGAPITKLPKLNDQNGPLLTLEQEILLQTLRPLAPKSADKHFTLQLQGSMQPYAWQMTSSSPLMVKSGDRVEITLVNQSPMSHPIHLHGHHFQLLGANAKRLGINGALRDTVLVPTKTSVTLAFDAQNPGDYWAFHCHHLYHMLTGMMTHIAYDASR